MKNITAIYEATSSANSSVRALLGTPLAAASRGNPYQFQMNLYFLSTEYEIVELLTLDLQGGNWSFGGLTGKNFKTATNSQLAAYWQQCSSGCTQAPFVLYEDEQQNLHVGNATNNWADAFESADINIVSGSGLAIVPLGDPPNKLRAYMDVSQIFQELGWEEANGWYYST
jgi:hypothetical protein